MRGMAIEVTPRCTQACPGAAVGVLVMRGADNSTGSDELERAAARVEAELRSRFAAGGRQAILADPVIAAYSAYYRRFRKTYHVALKVESVAIKGKHIPSAGALVKAMFAAELASLLLTAGHDLSKVEPPLRLDAGAGTETYTALGGSARTVKESDLLISDGRGVISSIIGGPDDRSSITEATRDALFVVYAPPGVPEAAVRAHLQEIERLVRLASPSAVTDTAEVVRA